MKWSLLTHYLTALMIFVCKYYCHSRWNVTTSLIPQNSSRKQMCSVEISLLVARFPPPHISWNLTLKQLTKEPTRSHAPRCHDDDVDFVLLHNITCYTISLLSRIHVNTADLLNFMCILSGRRDIREVRVCTCMTQLNLFRLFVKLQ